MTVSAVINTFNEAKILDDCLRSVRDWVDEIVVIDQGSKDETLKVAAKYKAEIFSHKHVSYVELVRNFSIEKTCGDWVLVLDPDERIPKSLAEYLKETVRKDEVDVVKIPRKNIIFGKWIKHTNWWPDYHVRFFKKGKVSWDERIHQYPKVEGRVLTVPSREGLAIEHLNYDSVSEFLKRQNRYTDVSAQNRKEAGEKFSWKNFFWKPARVFLQRYIRHAGFLDGFYGLSLSLLTAYSQLSEEVKVWELMEKQNTELT